MYQSQVIYSVLLRSKGDEVIVHKNASWDVTLPSYIYYVVTALLFQFVALNDFQGRRGWSKGPLTTVALALSMPTFSWPLPCEETQIRSRDMTMEKRTKGQLTITQYGNPGSNGSTLSKYLIWSSLNVISNASILAIKCSTFRPPTIGKT